MKDPLTACLIALTGDFGPTRSLPALKKWIEANGGKVAKAVSPKTTHLVCSKEAWKKQTATVKAALKHEGIKIVSYDWLEDSLHHRKCRAVRKYLWEKIEKEGKVQKRARKKVKKEKVEQADSSDGRKVREFKEGCELAWKDLLSDTYHLYRDTTTFVYNIILFRVDVSNNRIERYCLRLYESNPSPPHYYACSATYHHPTHPSITHILAPTGSSYQTAFSVFRRFFLNKTNVSWNFRFHGKRVEEKTWSGEVLEEGEGEGKWYAYTLPDVAKGEAVGDAGLMRQAVEMWGKAPAELRTVGGAGFEGVGGEELGDSETE